MRIAVTYDYGTGEIFQHFGRSEFFKVYEVQDNQVLYSEVIGSEGSGHSALAALLDENAINVLICGGIGGGAISALDLYGIQTCPGASGDADAAVEAYLKGELLPGEANCGHHHGEEGGCCGHHGEGEEGGCCGHHEEGGEGCCGRHSQMQGRNVGKTCKVHYRGTFNDGSQFDSSYDRGQTLDFVCGAGMMIKGFDQAVADMEVGQSVDVHLMPEEAYGMPDPAAIFTVGLAELPGAEELPVGAQVYLQTAMGQPFPVRVTAKDDTTITFDANSEMAGKELNFHIELIEVV